MELQRTTLTEQERETLIQRIWDDKGGRADRNRSLALYVSLDSPRPDLTEITDQMFTQLLDDPIFAFNWAEDWGRVVVCVAPKVQLGCLLGNMKNPDNKRFVPVHTIRKLEQTDLQELIGVLPKGNMGTIFLNSQPTTIEAFLISYVHMLDQAIWDVCRGLAQQSKKSKFSSYENAVEFVKSHVFSVKLATEDEILVAKSANDRVSVRLYGSQINPDVPRVMGAVVPKEGL